jgi:hypothetical protein
MWKSRLVAVWTLTITAAGPVRDRVLAGGRDERAGGPDVIFHHGKIFTADPAAPTAQAVAIRRDRVVAVGTDEVVLASAEDTTRKVDLIERGIRGLLVPDERGIGVVYVICEPASHYYRNMAGSARMPVLIGDPI